MARRLEPMGFVEGAAADADVVRKALERQRDYHRAFGAVVNVNAAPMLSPMLIELRLAARESHLRLEEARRHP